MMNKNFWKNKKVLVTGHTGFKGRWLCVMLKILGANVSGISLREKNNYKKIEYINFLPRKKSYLIDIRKRLKIEKIILKINPEIIIHMAAQSKVIDGLKFPIKTFETNFMGTVNILDISIKLKKLKMMLIITTDKVYENIRKRKKFSENDKLGGDDPYSASKASTEIILDCYRKLNSKIKIMSLRAGNIIGGGDFGNNRIVPDIVKAWNNDNSLFLRNPKSTRPWQYVLDVIVAYMRVIEISYKSKRIPLSLNIGPFKSNISVENLTLKFKSQFKNLKYNKTKKQKKSFEKKNLELDIKKSVKFLRLKNNIDLDNRIIRTSNCYKKILKTSNKNKLMSIYENEALNFLKNYNEKV